jgi:hypothetical protein
MRSIWRCAVLACFGLLSTSAGTGAFAGDAPSRGPGLPATGRPVQGWAYQSGLVNLPAQAGVKTTADPMARLLIEDAFSRYAVAVDEGRSDVLNSLFTDDIHVDIVEASKAPLVSVSGRDKVVANFASAWKQQGDQRRHLISNFVFNNLTASSASLIAYGVVIVSTESLSVGTSVIYTAELHRNADGNWQFSRLLVGMDKYVGPKPRPPK